MDRRPDPENDPGDEAVRRALLAGITPSVVVNACHEATELARLEIDVDRRAPLDGQSWTEGLVYGLLWIVGKRTQVPSAYLESQRELGGIR